MFQYKFKGSNMNLNIYIIILFIKRLMLCNKLIILNFKSLENNFIYLLIVSYLSLLFCQQHNKKNQNQAAKFMNEKC